MGRACVRGRSESRPAQSDPHFLGNINELFGLLQEEAGPEQPVWKALPGYLHDSLATLHGHSEAFRQVDQATAVLRLAFSELPAAYRDFHRDLLLHQSDESLFQPFFRAGIRSHIRQGPPWDQTDRIVPQALRELNDYLGYRPVAVLRSRQKIQPYAHEWVGPIPLYLRGAGVAAGRYHDLIQQGLAILEATDADPAGRRPVRSAGSWRSCPWTRGRTTSTIRSSNGPTTCSANGTWGSWTIRAGPAASSCNRSPWTPC